MRTHVWLSGGLMVAMFAGANICIGADEPVEADPIIKHAAPTIRAIEAAILGKAHPDLDSFIAQSATFEGRPLKEVLNDPEARSGPFRENSQLRWLTLKSLQAGNLKQAIPEARYPEGLNRADTILVFREYPLELNPETSFRLLYWLSLFGENWMVVRVDDGRMPTEPLKSGSRPVPKELLSSDDEKHEVDPVVKQIAPTIRAVEAAILGKFHPNFDTFIAPSATFEGMPLVEVLQDPRSRVEAFHQDSEVRWLKLEAFESDALRGVIPEEAYPKGIDRDNTVLVSREYKLGPESEHSYRSTYWISLVGDDWMVVTMLDGGMPTEPLRSASKPVPQSLLSEPE